MVEGRYQVVSRTRAIETLQEILDGQVDSMLKLGYVSNKTADSFHGNLKMFDEIRILAEVQDSIARSSAEAKALKDAALQKVKEYTSSSVVTSVATEEQLNVLNSDLEKVTQEIAVASAELGELKAMQGGSAARDDIAAELEKTQVKYNELIARQNDIEQARAKVQLHDDVEVLLPKVKALRAIADQKSENEQKRYALTSEIEWQEKELASVNKQLEDKERQYMLQQDKRSRVEALNVELNYITSLYDKNKELNETLIELSEREQRLSSDKAAYTNQLAQVEKNIAEIRDSIDEVKAPARSVGELLESVRVDVKIDEVTSQMERLESEIAVKESQIAARESSLVLQTRRFRAVAELDSAVTPIKAKDTILQVLDTKYSKLESINESLKEKHRNLERAMEDYKYRIEQLDQSRASLEASRERALFRKQEEFKREVQSNSQKVYVDDASTVFMPNTSFNDDEIEALNQEISARNLDRDLLMERAYQLEGSIKEIKRHMDINDAEMDSLRREKENIVKRYNEIVAQSNNEIVFNYIKALQSDNGTKYLLDVQQEAVRSEAELGELKHTTDTLRDRLAELKSRLKHLRETQQQMDNTRSVDTIVTTNDKLKDELADIGTRLSASYEQYKAITTQITEMDEQLESVRGEIVEATKSIKVNEDQIALANQRAQRYAGGEDIEQALAELKYELGDVESERNMLLDSKATLDKELYLKRLEQDKANWLYDEKTREYDELYQELKVEFNLKGLDIDKVAVELEDVEQLREIVEGYDAARRSLSEKIDSLYSLTQAQPTSTVKQSEIDAKQKQVDKLKSRQQELEQQRKLQFSSYVAASTARNRMSIAAAEARTISNLRETLAHNEIMDLLINDKVKHMLDTATRHLNTLLGANTYKLVARNYTLHVVNGSDTVAYDDLPQDIKTATYLSVLLSLPNTDVSDSKWLVFDERINIDKDLLSNMLQSIGNVSYVIGYNKEN